MIASVTAAGAEVSKLVKAYPDFVKAIEDGHVVFMDGSKLPVSDGKAGKSARDLLIDPDIDDMFAYPYPDAFPSSRPPNDPGRIRNHAFFAKMYGDCAKGGLSQKLVAVPWLPKHKGGSVMVTPVNGVAEKLKAISAELDALPEDLIVYAKPSAGTFNCRVVADTGRPSAHGYAIAIDINVDKSDYHLWGKDRYRNRIPKAIVDIFERHGFIWGGKWHAYDTMHFEYRPELLP